MSKVSFQKPGGPASMTEPTASDTQVVNEVPANAVPVNTTTAVATVPVPPPPSPASHAFHDDENIDPSDLELPRLNIVQKVGDLSNVFNPGSIVLDGSVVLVDAPDKSNMNNLSNPIRLVVIGFQATKFVEKVDGGAQGLTLASEQEVAANNGTLDYKEAKRTGKRWFQRSTVALVLVEQPEGDKSDYFNTPIASKHYALALWTLKGTGYTNGAKPIKTKRKIGELRGPGFRGGVFKVQSKLEQYGPNFAYIPVPKLAELTTEEFRKGLSELGF